MPLIHAGSLGAGSPPADPPSRKETPVALKEYSTVINGMATTVQLSDEDAKLQGFTSKDLVSNQEVEVTEAHREAEAEDPQHAEAKAKTAANKQASAPQNKGAAPQAPKA